MVEKEGKVKRGREKENGKVTEGKGKRKGGKGEEGKMAMEKKIG